MRIPQIVWSLIAGADSRRDMAELLFKLPGKTRTFFSTDQLLVRHSYKNAVQYTHKPV